MPNRQRERLFAADALVQINMTASSSTDTINVFDFSAINNTGGDLMGATATGLFAPIPAGYSLIELTFSFIVDAFGVESFHIGILDGQVTLHSPAEARPLAPVPLPATALLSLGIAKTRRLACQLRKKRQQNRAWRSRRAEPMAFARLRIGPAPGRPDSRGCLATDLDTLISGIRAARKLDRSAEMRGYPCMVTEPRR